MYRPQDFGKLYGLPVTELTKDQLEMVEFSKLLECALVDERIIKIVGDKLSTCTARQISHIKNCRNKRDRFEYIIEKYNEYIVVNSDKLEKQEAGCPYVPRSQYIFWELLSDENKQREYVRWYYNHRSIIIPRKINYVWLYDMGLEFADMIVEKVLCTGIDSDVIHAIKNTPKETGLKFIDKIFELKPDVYIHMLSNHYTPRSYIIKALRGIAGRKRIPRVKMTIDKSILLDIPSVSRLKVLETLVYSYNQVTFSDIHNQEDVEALLFGTSLQYNERVKKVIQYFNRKFKIQ